MNISISQLRKEFDDLERGKIRKMREKIGEPWDICSIRPPEEKDFCKI